jgi:hypothetical protein
LKTHKYINFASFLARWLCVRRFFFFLRVLHSTEQRATETETESNRIELNNKIKIEEGSGEATGDFLALPRDCGLKIDLMRLMHKTQTSAAAYILSWLTVISRKIYIKVE